MYKRMSITLDEKIYDGLHRMVDERHINKFIEDLLRPHVIDSLNDGYQAMAADKHREAEAVEWCNALIKDINDATR